MKLTILLESEDGPSAPVMLSNIERKGPLNAANLGLTLAESKSLLSSVQEELVKSQFQEYVQKERACARCGTLRTLKDYHSAHLKSLFGGVRLRVPRLNGCCCEGQGNRTHTVKIDGLVNWVSPRLEFVQSQLAAMIPYARTAHLLELLLPVGNTNRLCFLQVNGMASPCYFRWNNSSRNMLLKSSSPN